MKNPPNQGRSLEDCLFGPETMTENRQSSTNHWVPPSFDIAPRPARRGAPKRVPRSPSGTASPPPKRARLSTTPDRADEDMSGPSLDPDSSVTDQSRSLILPAAVAGNSDPGLVAAEESTAPIDDPTVASDPAIVHPAFDDVLGNSSSPEAPELSSSLPVNSNTARSASWQGSDAEATQYQNLRPPSLSASSSTGIQTRFSANQPGNTSRVQPSNNATQSPPMVNPTQPTLSRSGRVIKSVKPHSLAQHVARPKYRGRIEILDWRFREGDGKEKNALDLLYKMSGEDGDGTWEKEDILWKTYEEEIVRHWGKKGKLREDWLDRMMGRNKSQFYLAEIYKHRPLKGKNPRQKAALAALADDDVRKYEYNYGWIGYAERKWQSWDQLGDVFVEVRKDYLEKQKLPWRDYLATSGGNAS